MFQQEQPTLQFLNLKIIDFNTFLTYTNTYLKNNLANYYMYCVKC